MRRKLAALLTSAALALSMLAAGAPAVQAVVGTCDNASASDNYFGGAYISPVGNATEAEALIDPLSSTFNWCTSPTTTVGPSAWVALTDAASTNENNIAQVGIIRCYGGASVCAPNVSGIRYFWAAGGCSQVPTAHDLGAANYNAHRFTVTSAVNPSTGIRGFTFLIDGVVKASTSSTCWSNNDMDANYSGETWDTGDSLGTNGGTELVIYSVKYAVNDGAWVTPSWTTGAVCNGNYGHYCYYTSSTGMRIYST